MEWKDLSINDRAELIRLGTQYGLRSIKDIKDFYNKYKDGGAVSNDKDYYNWLEKEAETNAKNWGMSADEAFTQMANDNTYNYREFYNNQVAKGQNGHYTDKYKTVYHPTFSEESMYSGKKSQYNPEGIIGGKWGNNSYNLSQSQRNSNWDVNRTQHYLDRADPGYVVNKFDKGGTTNQANVNNNGIQFGDIVVDYNAFKQARPNTSVYRINNGLTVPKEEIDKTAAILNQVPADRLTYSVMEELPELEVTPTTVKMGNSPISTKSRQEQLMNMSPEEFKQLNNSLVVEQNPGLTNVYPEFYALTGARALANGAFGALKNAGKNIINLIKKPYEIAETLSPVQRAALLGTYEGIQGMLFDGLLGATDDPAKSFMLGAAGAGIGEGVARGIGRAAESIYPYVKQSFLFNTRRNLNAIREGKATQMYGPIIRDEILKKEKPRINNGLLEPLRTLFWRNNFLDRTTPPFNPIDVPPIFYIRSSGIDNVTGEYIFSSPNASLVIPYSNHGLLSEFSTGFLGVQDIPGTITMYRDLQYGAPFNSVGISYTNKLTPKNKTFNPVLPKISNEDAIALKKAQHDFLEEIRASLPKNSAIGGSSILVENEAIKKTAGDLEVIALEKDMPALKRVFGIEDPMMPTKTDLGIKKGTYKAKKFKYNEGNIDIDILEVDKEGNAKGKLAHELYATLFPDQYAKLRNDAAKRAIATNNYTFGGFEDSLPISGEELMTLYKQGDNPVRFQIANYISSPKIKHTKALNSMMTNPEITNTVREEIINKGRSYVIDYIPASEAYPDLDLTDIEANKIVLKRLGFDEELASNPEVMSTIVEKLHFDNLMGRHSIPSGYEDYLIGATTNKAASSASGHGGNFTFGNGGGNSFGRLGSMIQHTFKRNIKNAEELVRANDRMDCFLKVPFTDADKAAISEILEPYLSKGKLSKIDNIADLDKAIGQIPFQEVDEVTQRLSEKLDIFAGIGDSYHTSNVVPNNNAVPNRYAGNYNKKPDRMGIAINPEGEFIPTYEKGVRSLDFGKMVGSILSKNDFVKISSTGTSHEELIEGILKNTESQLSRNGFPDADKEMIIKTLQQQLRDHSKEIESFTKKINSYPDAKKEALSYIKDLLNKARKENDDFIRKNMAAGSSKDSISDLSDVLDEIEQLYSDFLNSGNFTNLKDIQYASVEVDKKINNLIIEASYKSYKKLDTRYLELKEELNSCINEVLEDKVAAEAELKKLLLKIIMGSSAVGGAVVYDQVTK